MNIFSKVKELEEVKEVKIEDLIKDSEDKGLVIEDKVGIRKEGLEEEEKKAVALDALTFGVSNAAKIHGVPQSSASKYANGLDVKEDTKTEILNQKHGIQDLAITKLMETLDMFDPKEMTKPREIVSAAAQLSQIVDKMNPVNKSGDSGVHLHFYSPRQKKIEDYKVIDVG